jgi:hypothetical protein
MRGSADVFFLRKTDQNAPQIYLNSQAEVTVLNRERMALRRASWETFLLLGIHNAYPKFQIHTRLK